MKPKLTEILCPVCIAELQKYHINKTFRVPKGTIHASRTELIIREYQALVKSGWGKYQAKKHISNKFGISLRHIHRMINHANTPKQTTSQ